MKLYLIRNSEEMRDKVHGVDYWKGVKDEACGLRHEFWTQGCQPVFVTEEDLESMDFKLDELVEIVPFRSSRR